MNDKVFSNTLAFYFILEALLREMMKMVKIQ